MENKKIFYFGTLPPPVGGVSMFNEKFTNYLKNNNNSVYFFSLKGLKNLFKSYDVSFINYSLSWKRFIAAFISFIICKKTVVIVHSSLFKMNFFNLLTLVICSKIVTTSDEVIYNSRIKHKFIKVDRILFKEFFFEGKKYKVGNNISKVGECRYTILFYQFNNDKIDGKYIYGSDKMLELLISIKNNKTLPINVIWIDLSGELENILLPYSSFVEYIKYPVDLNQLWERVDLLIRPTLFDGTAFMLIEAMLNNVKVLCSDLPSRPDGVYRIPKDCHSIPYDLIEKILKDNTISNFNDKVYQLLPSINNLFDNL